MADLRFAGTKLAKDLGDRLRLDATWRTYERENFAGGAISMENVLANLARRAAPPRSLSSSALPVVMRMTFSRRAEYSIAVMKPASTILAAASLILSTLASLMPLMLSSILRVHICTPLTVQMPAAFSLARSAALMPAFCSSSMSRKNSCRHAMSHSGSSWC